jgi:hypothetical protein
MALSAPRRIVKEGRRQPLTSMGKSRRIAKFQLIDLTLVYERPTIPGTQQPLRPGGIQFSTDLILLPFHEEQDPSGGQQSNQADDRLSL